MRRDLGSRPFWQRQHIAYPVDQKRKILIRCFKADCELLKDLRSLGDPSLRRRLTATTIFPLRFIKPTTSLWIKGMGVMCPTLKIVWASLRSRP